MSELKINGSDKKVVIIGGGPAGLTAAHQLIKEGIPTVVIEKLDKVGGISRTENYRGAYFDMGGHRFFSKSAEVNQFWNEVMQDEFLLRPRLSRIYYNHKFFYYPLQLMNALMGLGPWQGTLIVLSYLKWQFFPYKEEDTFEQWVTNRFGQRLFLTFFKSYTEKLWGISTSELKAEWAAQRIKDLSLKTALINMMIKRNNHITSLIEEFHYPRFGPGMLWNRVKEEIECAGGSVLLNQEVTRIHHHGNRIESVDFRCNGCSEQIKGSHFISSVPLKNLINSLDPPPPESIRLAANKLKMRDFLTVCLILGKPQLFKDNWIYIHDPGVKVLRIQNFGNWSPYMVPGPSLSSLGLEYVCNQGDHLWQMPDRDLIELGKSELEQIGLAEAKDVLDGCVFRVENCYPVYDDCYRECVAEIKEYLRGFDNFQTIGRNGLHRYDNQDHAMITGMLAVRNLLYNEDNNLWEINSEQEYQETIQERKIPDRVMHVVDDALAQVFSKLDPLAFGGAWGIVCAGLLLLTTAAALSFQWDNVIAKLSLLYQYFPGYTVEIQGLPFGLLYGFIFGFLLGWAFAFLRNISIIFYIAMMRRRIEFGLFRKLIEL